MILVHRHATGQSRDVVDVQPVAGSDVSKPFEMPCGQLGTNQRHDVAWLALRVDPSFVLVETDRRESGLQIPLVRLEENVLQYWMGFGLGRHLDEKAEGQRVMNDRLTNIEHPNIMPSQDRAQVPGDTRPICSGQIDEDHFGHGLAPLQGAGGFSALCVLSGSERGD